MNVTRNVMLEPRLTPGGGAVEMALSRLIYSLKKNLFYLFFLLLEHLMQ
jgi:chaperonin GroEL (HSP60 family)